MSRLKIIQIESIYSEFARELYRKNPELINASFREQINAVLLSGWSGGQNIIPYLNPSLWSRHYIIPSLLPAQLRWARDYKLTAKSEMSISEILYRQIESVEPDVIYLSDLGSFDFSILRSLKKRPFVCAWLASRPPSGVNWEEIDLLLSGVGKIREVVKQMGVKATADFNSAAPPFGVVCDQVDHSQKGVVVFSGSFMSNVHDDRATLFKSLARKMNGCTLDIYSQNSNLFDGDSNIRTFPAVYGSKVIETYSGYQVVVDSRADFGLGEARYARDTSNMRIFEATRSGSMLITEYSPNLEGMFDIGREIVCYTSDEDFFGKLDFYTSPAGLEEARDIALSGFHRVLSSHTIEMRAEQFSRLVLDAIG